MLGTNYTLSHSTRLKTSMVTSSLNNFVKKLQQLKLVTLKVQCKEVKTQQVVICNNTVN